MQKSQTVLYTTWLLNTIEAHLLAVWTPLRGPRMPGSSKLSASCVSDKAIFAIISPVNDLRSKSRPKLNPFVLLSTLRLVNFLAKPLISRCCVCPQPRTLCLLGSVCRGGGAVLLRDAGPHDTARFKEASHLWATPRFAMASES